MPTRDSPEDRGPSQWDGIVFAERMGAIRFSVHARPGSSRSGILGVRDGSVDIAVKAPPADGAANAELIQVIAKALDVRRGEVTILIGASGRLKLVEVSGVAPEDARARLAGACR